MMSKYTLWRIAVFLLFFPQLCSAAIEIRSAVSPEFPDGLHAKYLRYLAEKADMTLKLYPIPFARRIIALERGEIDIMVGIKHSYEVNENLVFLQPSYEQLRGAYFVRADEFKILQDESQLQDIIMGISIEDESVIAESKLKFKEVVPVTNLIQKIHLLRKGRIDSFSHFESSALRMIADEGLAEDIVVAPYQKQQYKYYHFAVGRNSSLLIHWEMLEEIIRKGVEQGDFLDIRLAHYAEQAEAREN